MSSLDYLSERVNSIDSRLENLATTSQNLAIVSAQHEQQLQLIQKIVYACCGTVLLHFLYSLLRGMK